MNILKKKNPEKITPKPNEDTKGHKYFQLNESYQMMVRTPFFFLCLLGEILFNML